jgi:hypothetical protein
MTTGQLVYRGSDIIELMKVITDMRHELEKHIIADGQSIEKTDAMYKVLVTGNGIPSLQERVRELEKWMASERKVVLFVGAIVAADVVARVWNLVLLSNP